MRTTPTSRQETEAQRRAARLAELVAGLTGCEQTGALHAVREHQDEERPDALGLVARAMIDVDAPNPEGFRVAGFLKDDDVSSGAAREMTTLHHGPGACTDGFTRRLAQLHSRDERPSP